MPSSGSLQRQNSKLHLPPAVPEASAPPPQSRPLFLINTGDCCLTASDSRTIDAARADARKVSGWSSSIQQPYRPLGVIAPVLLPPSFRKKGHAARNGHLFHTVAAAQPQPQPPLVTSSTAAAPAAHSQIAPRPPAPPHLQLNRVSVDENDGATARAGEAGGSGRGGGVSARRRLVATDTTQADADALDSFRFVAAVFML